MPLVIAAVLGVSCALLPLGYLIIRTAGVSTETLDGTTITRQLIPWTLNSLVLVAAVAASTLVLGAVIAWLLSCTDLPGRRVLRSVSAMPLAIPSYIAAFGWLSVLPGLQGFWPSWMILTAVSTPYVVLPVLAAVARADMALIEEAQVSGRSPARSWLVGLGPQVAPAAAAGTLLAAIYTLSDFGAVALLRHEVLTFMIQRQYSSFVGRERAALFGLVLVAGALVLVLAERRFRGNAQRYRTAAGAARPIRPVSLGRARIPALLLVLSPVVVAVVLPVAALLQRLQQGTRRPLDWAELVDALSATTTAALLGGTVAILAALPIGVLAARYATRSATTLETLGYAAHALPGIVVGLSLVYFSLKVVPSLYQSLAVLVFAYAVLFFPKAIGSVRTSVASVPPSLPMVAATLGRPPWRAGLVTARLAGPGILTGFLLVVVTAMKELPATLILRPTGFDTLATEIWSRTSATAPGAAAPYALALVLLASVPSYLIARESRGEAA